MKFLWSGKVKDIFDCEDGTLIFKFSNRVSAYDVKFKEEIPKKGEVLCKFAEYWFNELSVDNHFVKRKSDTEIIVKKMQMLPIECIVRGYFYGSLVNRWKKGELSVPDGSDTRMAGKLSEPIFDPTTKAAHDIPVTKEIAIEMRLVSEDDYQWLEKKSIEIYKKMATIADAAGFILADLKLEFGKLGDNILLGDSIGPDEYRLWLKENYSVGRIQEAFDKQILRDWLTAECYQKRFEEERALGKDSLAPQIPQNIIEKMTERYVMAYEKLTGKLLQ